MTNERNYAKGLIAFTIWIPDGLRQAIHARARRDGRSTQIALTRLLRIWTGYTSDDQKEKAGSPGDTSG